MGQIDARGTKKIAWLVLAALMLAFAMVLSSAISTVYAISPVFVRTDGSDANCDGTANVAYPGSGTGLACAKATIGGGIAVVDVGGTVNVASGVYNEAVTIDKALNLIGDPGDSTPGPGANAPILDGTGLSGLSAISLNQGVSGVVIRGFEIRNYGPTGVARAKMQLLTSSLQRDLSQPLEVNEALLMLDSSRASAIKAWNAGTSSVTVEDNYMHDLGWNGILVGNEGQGLHTNWEVSKNIVTADAYGIELTNANNSEISDNQVTVNSTNWSSAVFMNSYNFVGTGISSNGNLIQRNTITVTGSTPGTGIVLTSYQTGSGSSASLANVNIADNNISSSGGAVVAFPSNGAETRNISIENNNIQITNPAGSTWYGFYAIHGHSWEGPANSVKGNSIVLTGTRVVTYYHGINVSGGTTSRNWIDIVDNGLDGGNIGSAGILLDSTLPTAADINVLRNSITGFQNGVRVGTIDSNVNLNIHHNRIVDNTWGIVSDVSISPQNNWWGCNAGPNAFGCDHISSTAVYTPWLVLNFSASPTSIPINTGVSALQANLNFNSDGANVSGSTTVPDNIQAVFTSTIGSVSPLSRGTISGVVTSTLSAGSFVAIGDVSVTVDHQTLSQTISVEPAPAPTTLFTYLPLIFKNSGSASAADLTITNVTATSSQIQVTIKNQGNATVDTTDGFWVDFYIAPNPVPTGVNQVWDDGRSTYGGVWGIPQQNAALAPGDSLVLTYSTLPGAPNSYWVPSLSNIPASLTPGTPVYAQVDSANINTTYGAVLEIDELTSVPYNNIFSTTAQ